MRLRLVCATHKKSALLPFAVRALCSSVEFAFLWIFSRAFCAAERKSFDRLADSKKCKIRHGEGTLKNDRLTDWSANDERWISRDSRLGIVASTRSAREQRTFVWCFSKHENVIASCPQSISQLDCLVLRRPRRLFLLYVLALGGSRKRNLFLSLSLGVSHQSPMMRWTNQKQTEKSS